MQRLAERTSVRLAVFALIALLLVWTSLGSAGSFNEYRDAQVLTLHEQAASLSVRSFGELPLWNPWYCGGIYGLGEPQSRFASPAFFLTLLFGVERAQPVVVFLFAILGMEGTYRWLRLRVADASAAFRVAPVFALSGQFAVSYFRGWINFFGFELLPFLLFGVTLAARGRTRGIAIAAVAFAVMMGFGGTFSAPIIAVAALVEGLRALAEQPRHLKVRAFVMLAVVASFMLTFAAVRLLPLAETLSAQPRIMAGTPGHAPKAIFGFVVDALRVKDGEVLDAGAFFVGAAFLALVAFGGGERKSIVPLVIIIVFLWLSAGYARRPPLFALLRELPVFSALRYPERFLWVAILYACEPAAHALGFVPRLGETRSWRVSATALLTIACVMTVGMQIAGFWRVSSARDLGALAEPNVTEFRQARGNRWRAAHYPSIGAGSLSCWETHPVIMSSKLRGDLAAEEYVADPADGQAKRVSWSPNAITVAVTMARAGRLLVNQNWHPGWRASVGEVTSDDGLLSVDLPPGEHRVTLSFRPRSALVGVVVSVLALGSLLALGWQSGRGRYPFRRRAIIKTAALVLAPWAALGMLVLTWKEPRYPPATVHNANGSPAIVTALPSDATTLDVRLSEPLVVAGGKVAGPDRFRNVSIDVFFRRTAALARTTAMFVHVVRRDGQPPPAEPIKEKRSKDDPTDFFNADHQVVGGSFYLSDAPEGALVDDAFGVHLGKAVPGDYDVWVSFGHVSARRGRAHIVEAGHAEINEERIKVGSFVVR